MIRIISALLAVGLFFEGLHANARIPEQINQGEVKNVIFLIPDGFSASYAANYRWFRGRDSLMDTMLVGMSRTHSASSIVTDSAAAGTAMATGVKTNNGMISISPYGKKLKTILEAAEESGKATGLVATSTITHATPAAFASHVDSRAKQGIIAPQLIENGVDVIFGGGRRYFPDSLLKKAEESGYRYIKGRVELAGKITSDKVIGLFAEKALAPSLDRDDVTQPSLAEMTESALDIVSRDKDGFFLMVEGSQVDWAGHDNDAAWAMNEVAEFENAVAAALSFAQKDKQTLIVIAGDHDTGGISVGGYNVYKSNVNILRDVTATGNYMASLLYRNRSNVKAVVERYTRIRVSDAEAEKIRTAYKPDQAINKIVSEHALVGWTSIKHTGVDVPLYAYGPGSELFRGLHQNTDIPVLMARALGIDFVPGK